MPKSQLFASGKKKNCFFLQSQNYLKWPQGLSLKHRKTLVFYLMGKREWYFFSKIINSNLLLPVWKLIRLVKTKLFFIFTKECIAAKNYDFFPWYFLIIYRTRTIFSFHKEKANYKISALKWLDLILSSIFTTFFFFFQIDSRISAKFNSTNPGQGGSFHSRQYWRFT